MDNGRLQRKKTLTMNWEGLDDDDDDDRFFESCQRISSAVPLDSLSSDSDDDNDYEESRISFAASSLPSHDFRTPTMSPDYNVWMSAPGSITERRRRLLHGMGLAGDKEPLSLTSDEFKRAVSIQRAVSSKVTNGHGHGQAPNDDTEGSKQDHQQQHTQSPPVPVLLVRSRSDSDIESSSAEKERKVELLGTISKQRLTRTSSTISAPRARICSYLQTPARASPMDPANGLSVDGGGSPALTSIFSKTRFGAFVLIKNLDTGKEFIVNECDEDGMWNRLSDLQTGKQLTKEEFEKCVGYSPVVKELMRRENVNSMNFDAANDFRKINSYLSKSLRMSKRRGAALLKNIKYAANSMSLRVNEKEKDNNTSPPLGTEQKQGKGASNEWVKVRQTGKSYKELSALHLCQEIQAHQGSIWTIKFSLDGHWLASAGEDRIIHVWEVQECEVMSMNEGSLTPLHPSMERSGLGEALAVPPEKKKRGKGSSGRKGNTIPDYVNVPEIVFSLSEKPICSFKGHLADVLDLSWSRSEQLLSSSMDKTVRLWDLETKSCVKLFAHNDYVTCIQFNPMDDNYFISGSLDAKVRIWSVPDRQVVDWTDLHEMITATCYTPDGQGALIGSHKGGCRMYSTEDCKLNQIHQLDMHAKKKAHAKKITGFQFSPGNPSEVLVTSADSQIRILDGSNFSHKFLGFRNTSSQISASFTLDGKYVICASEDSHVYVWKHEDLHRSTSSGKKPVITTRSHEQFQCRDVSVAIPWPGTVKGEPPPMLVQSKRPSKRATTQPPSANGSPTKEDSPAAANSKKMLPPLPKKNNHVERTVTPPEEELAQISRSESGIGESFSSNSSSMRHGDSPSISSVANSNSSSVRHGDSPCISIASYTNSSSIRHDDSPSISSVANANSSSVRYGDSPSISAASNVPSSSWSSSWSWFDGSHGTHTVQPTAWGLVIVTATLGGEIRTYQNFGLPRRIGRQANLF